MKKLIVLLGPNGVGKSTTAKALLQRCPNSAWVDADWCRSINPFELTPATKKTVTDNLYCLLCNYLQCKDIQTVVFTYGLHGERKEIYEELLRRLRGEKLEFDLCPIVLKCTMEETIRRGKADGRDRERIERGIQNTYFLYDGLTYPCIDTTDLTPEDTADQILSVACPMNAPAPNFPKRSILGLLAATLFLISCLLLWHSARTSEPTDTTPTAETTLATTETAARATSLPTEAPTEESTDETTQATTEETTEPAQESTEAPTEASSEIHDFVMNKNSKKFHYPDCESVAKMKESNKEFFTGTRDELIEQGYEPCGNCKP